MDNDTCPICNGTSENEMHPDDMSIWTIKCNSCGTYTINDSLYFSINEKTSRCDERQIINASHFLRSQNNYIISKLNVDNVLSKKTPSFQDRNKNILLFLEKKCHHMGEEILISANDLKLLESAWAFNYKELVSFMEFLKAQGFVDFINLDNGLGNGWITITPKGWEHIEAIKSSNKDSEQGFVAMWFAPEMNKVYGEAIHPAIMAAGYNPIRVDQHEHNNDITDELIALIRRSKFVTADYTGHRGGVYYEAGFARGLGLEVFMTCRKDHMKDLHFDVNHRICIEWTEDNLPDLQKKLTNKIEATIGRGPIIHDA